MLYNSVWTSWPCFFTFVFDRDADAEYSLKNPILYGAGPAKAYFNFKTFWRWILSAIFSGCICYFISTIGLRGILDKTGQCQDSWFHSSLSFSLVIHIVTYKLFLESTMWNIINVVIMMVSLLFYYLCVILINAPPVADIIQP